MFSTHIEKHGVSCDIEIYAAKNMDLHVSDNIISDVVAQRVEGYLEQLESKCHQRKKERKTRRQRFMHLSNCLAYII